ncbi:PREDICTED: uncharacterized protein At5g19025 [Tarenaya hassleriana]|uniref:uncharacterized protein At5g19025 n=1 Tax=Tarenaya hassleriana TaxID=28532 RepID=UPI00053C9F75|nr:PREDICTED: uncharacterized protein At5g19025 [Tarenaya hassleriana]
MLHLLLSSSAASAATTMAPSSSSARSAGNHHHNHRSSTSLLLCKHSPFATLDVLILILVLFSGAFLLSSYLSYLFHSLSLLSSHFPSFSLSLSSLTPLIFSDHDKADDPSGIPPASYIFAFAVFFAASIAFLDLCCGPRSRKCQNPKCKGLKKAMEFDLQLQTEECVKSRAAKEIDRLPWKGGSESNSDYECLRAELRKMAPPNGRAVLLFRSRCGCPVAKLEGWGPKRGRRHKKSPGNLALKGGGDNR